MKWPNRPVVAVVGSINMDIVVESSSFPQPGETVMGRSIAYFAGGKGANQAVAAARLGADVRMIGAIGSDNFGSELLAGLKAEGIDTRGVKVTEGASGIASILVSGGENEIVVVPGANGELRPEDVAANASLIEEADIVLVQLEVPQDTVEAALKLAKTYGKKTVLNPAPAGRFPDEWLPLADIVTPNETELAALVGEERLDDPLVLQEATNKLHMRGASRIIVTLGANGAALSLGDGEIARVPGHRVTVVDTTGAGDTFHGALAAAWAGGLELPEALAAAVKASALSVTKEGAQTGMPTLEELSSWMS
ncbi:MULTISPECIES: ribokinase [Cohnella]|uniref:Ribokinase n=1 Tax=Cohnella phaseoli TaxID=456490 RepID=A0A3D9IS97_9BACL|nr:ribokinase [Cohnella phaseoli]RED64555.1 ribokinase [Cohnella phaseoli]